jgi:hypothetical protein
MAANAGPDIVEDGIVFYYDTGNTVKSYIGEPTENLFGTTAMAFQSDYPDFTSYIQNGSDSIGNYIIKDTVNAPWYTGLRVRDNGVRPLTTGVSYVVSFECQSPQYGWSWSLDSNQYGGDWDGNDSGRTSFTNLIFISTGGTTYTQDMVNTWQKVQYVVYMKSWSGGSPTAYPIDSFFPDINNIKVYYRNPQIEVSKTHATQYTPTSRSVTQGLLDMTANSTINLTDVSFDSNAKIVFDGTNDSLIVGNNITLKNNNTSIEFVINYLNTPNGDIIQFGVGSGTYAQYYYRAYSGYSFWNWYPVGTGYGEIAIPNGALPLNRYHHIVMTGNDQGYVQFYINGIAQTGATRTSNTQPSNWTPADLTVGGFSWDGYSSSVIPLVKIYNRVLSASEVLTNYNALKTRFGI